MQRLAAQRQTKDDAPLTGAHVVAAIASMKHGVTARALTVLRVDLDRLAAAARDEIVAAGAYR
jgi:hypothetical protein